MFKRFHINFGSSASAIKTICKREGPATHEVPLQSFPPCPLFVGGPPPQSRSRILTVVRTPSNSQVSGAYLTEKFLVHVFHAPVPMLAWYVGRSL